MRFIFGQPDSLQSAAVPFRFPVEVPLPSEGI